MKITVTTAFEWWAEGIRRVEYAPGDYDVEPACARYAIKEGYASETGDVGSSKKKKGE